MSRTDDENAEPLAATSAIESEEGAGGARPAAPCGCGCGRRRSHVFLGWARMSPLARIAAAPIFIYRLLLSPLWPHVCRFEPSCSTYALEALATHGPVRGLWLTARRVSRCHPFERLGGGSGYDPVPPKGGAAARAED